MIDLDWHIRLVDRMIKNNSDATIADYFLIIDKYLDECCSIEWAEREINKANRTFSRKPNLLKNTNA